MSNIMFLFTGKLTKQTLYNSYTSIDHEWYRCGFFLVFGRHGIRQLRTGWADGPAYITQCPIQPGQSYVYNFTITGQRGTLLWHAHILWLRATVHGALVVLPKRGIPYPFPAPHKEVVVVLGEQDT
jgi:hypothetical protein